MMKGKTSCQHVLSDSNVMVTIIGGGIFSGVLPNFWIGLIKANFQQKNLKVNCTIIANNSITFSGGTSLLNLCLLMYLSLRVSHPPVTLWLPGGLLFFWRVTFLAILLTLCSVWSPGLQRICQPFVGSEAVFLQKDCFVVYECG